MKYITTTLCFCFAFFLMAFTLSHQSAFKQTHIKAFPATQKILVKDTAITDVEFLFDYPDDIKEEDKKAFVKKIKKGKILYNINCAKCHTTTVNSKQVIPDFSLPQLMDYEIRFQYPEHQEDLKETNITVEELDMIIDFLRYKKKN